jgi:3-carboxy-cis,cis-muconate cycloisomerase
VEASVFERFLGSAESLQAFGAQAFVQAMLDFEAALAQAQAAEGLIGAEAARAIAAACHVEQFDLPALLEASGRAGSLAIPLVQQLKAQLGAHAAQAHFGATSQDAIDSALVLCTGRVLALVERDLASLVDALIALNARHGAAPVLARTLMQPAAVTSFGFKLLQWTEPLWRLQGKLRDTAREALQPQLGGAVGTLAAMGDRGPAVARRVAALLQLSEPQGSWHTQRDRLLRLGLEGALLAGALGKMARDWSLMGQGEIAELAEPSEPGRGGSTAMPHKRNPVASMHALAAAQRVPPRAAALLQAMGQEHERGLGNWQAELAEWAGLWTSLHGGLRPMAEAARGLQVDEQRMRSNIDALHAQTGAFDLATAQAARARAEEGWRRIEQQRTQWLNHV